MSPRPVLDKVYDPLKVEEKWYRIWEENELFHADVESQKPPYTIVIPVSYTHLRAHET